MTMVSAAELTRRSEAVIKKLEGAAAQIESARTEALEGAEDFSEALDITVSRECRSIADELLKLRARTERLVQREMELLENSRRAEAEQAACIHSWEPIQKVGRGHAKGVSYHCCKCFLQDKDYTGRIEVAGKVEKPIQQAVG